MHPVGKDCLCCHIPDPELPETATRSHPGYESGLKLHRTLSLVILPNLKILTDHFKTVKGVLLSRYKQ